MTRYVIITPARDEEAYIEQTILSVIRQTIRPVRWIIVDDGSRDQTGAIIDSYAAAYPWIKPLHRSNRGFRQAGGGVVNTFYEGYEQIDSSNWDFIVKLDADLSFAPDYFERCFLEFAMDPRLGIGGGGIYHEQKDGALTLEPNPKFHVRGATKIYKRECWEKLGGLLRAPGWDTVDEVKANMLGWTTRSFPLLEVSHQRFTGTADGAWKDCVKNGRANYIAGYHPIFMLFKCMRRLVARPYLFGALGLFWGFLSGYFVRIPQVKDRDLINYTRNQQMRRLLLQGSIWK
jgi:biofilm PGA synthesis N-glycosyltransferase PgaC